MWIIILLIAAGLVLGLVVAFGVTLLLRRLAKKKNTPENKQPKAKEENKVSNTKKDAETIPEEDASIATRENTMSDTQEEATPDSNEEVNASKSN